ncbi:UDP-N-acetylmuramate dehydrogenase [Porticoccaceae bacterium]|nr:UDP-N-acetylmuramate dehydrogenase [Porticoccaceae bacterium]
MTDSQVIVEQILKTFDLKDFNSLAIPAKAEFFCSIDSVSQLQQALVYAKQQNLQITPISGGSNLVLAADVSGLVLHINLKGVSTSMMLDNTVDISVAAGENWHDFVTLCLNNGWHGLENLALIPGNMGAAPIQNIGAYGVELSHFLQSVDVVDVETGQPEVLTDEDCDFGYRTSIFKQSALDKYVITGVNLRLSTQPVTHVSYPALADLLQGVEPTPRVIFDAVCQIRHSKLPDPKEIPNVGSFFKNPIVTRQQADNLSATYPGLPTFSVEGGLTKLAAAWLIEHCGFKGSRHGKVGVHHKQALVLVNFEGNGEDILLLAENIKNQVAEKFAVELEVEPRVYGKTQ